MRVIVRDLIYISIHALLAESDYACIHQHRRRCYFYPRSPCGERHNAFGSTTTIACISIHALLAESDRRLYSNSV